MALWDDTDLAAWRTTRNIALSQNIKLVLGLRPGFIDDLNATQNHVNNRAQQIMQSGIKDVVFAWDDVAGGGTLQQLTLQCDLVHETMHRGTVNVWAVVPPAYYGGADVQVPQGMKSTWANKLGITQQMPSQVQFILAGQEINPPAFFISQWPSQGGRGLIFWDNDAAIDTSTRLPWGLPHGRDPLLFSNQQYVLNLAFPPERVVHQVAAILLAEGNTTDISVVSEFWVRYLVQHGFVTASAQSQVQHDLATAITLDQRFDSIAALVAEYPSFQGIWVD
jgi:hypothetical protein